MPDLPSLDARGLPVGQPFDPEREITPREVKQKLDAGEAVDLIDCRLPREHDLTHIEPSRLIPLQVFAQAFDEHLAGREDRQVVVYCRSGVRSLDFVEALRARGFTNARSMAGGINLWNSDIEPGGLVY